jgi:hypothetical protein
MYFGGWVQEDQNHHGRALLVNWCGNACLGQVTSGLLCWQTEHKLYLWHCKRTSLQAMTADWPAVLSVTVTVSTHQETFSLCINWRRRLYFQLLEVAHQCMHAIVLIYFCHYSFFFSFIADWLLADPVPVRYCCLCREGENRADWCCGPHCTEWCSGESRQVPGHF